MFFAQFWGWSAWVATLAAAFFVAGSDASHSFSIFSFAGRGASPGYSGNGGLATLGSVNYPAGLAVDSRGAVYISELGNCVIRVVTPNRSLATAAGTGTCGTNGNGLATAVHINSPVGIVFDANDNLFFGELQSGLRGVGPARH